MAYSTKNDVISVERKLNIHPSFVKSSYTVYKRQLFRLLSSKMQIIFMLLMPILFLAVVGTAFNNIGLSFSASNGESINYLTFMTTGLIVMITLFSGTFGGISLFYDKDSGYLKNYLIAPASRVAIVVGYALGTATRVLIQVAVLFSLGILLGAKLNLTPYNIVIIFIFVILTTNFLLGVSITLASKAQNVEVFQQIIMPIVGPLQFIAPVMYPITFLPSILQPIAIINPITFGIDGIRATLWGKSLTSPLINIPLVANNIVLFDMVLLFVLGSFFLYLGTKLFLKSLSS